MKFPIAWFAFAAAVCGLAVAPAIEATPVTYDFSVHVYSGPLVGTDESGTFSYDSSLAVPGGMLYQTGLLSTFGFSFNGSSYGASTVDTGSLFFDASGNLARYLIGNTCGIGSCSITAGHNQWWISDSEFVYSSPGFNNFGYGTIKWSQVDASVAEPGTLGLFVLGLLLAGTMSRLLPATPASKVAGRHDAKCCDFGTCVPDVL